MSNTLKVTTPSVLAFSRIIEPTDGYFLQYDSKQKNAEPKPVKVQERSMRTTKSHRFKDMITKREDSFRKEASESNIQMTQIAYLDKDCDTLVVKFGLKILPFDGTPDSCNNSEYKQKLMQIVEEYAKQTDFKELSERYATNIANGRWLWRNRYVAKGAKITVEATTDKEQHVFEFESNEVSLKHANAGNNPTVSKLAKLIAKSLKGEVFLVMRVKAEVDMDYAHQVFPSEEMNLGEKNPEESSKKLFQVDGVAGLHAVKIGNALRTIDTWFDDFDNYGAPISVEIYGAVTRIGEAFRVSSSKNDFYNLLDSWVEDDEAPSLDSQHYVMAVLIRGGLFGKSAK